MDDETLASDTLSGGKTPSRRTGPSNDDPEGPDYSGNVIGDYKLLRRIAAGGMGEVYEAIQLKLDRRVAFKILHSRTALLPEFLARFEREAKSAAALNHPNIVQVFDFGQAGGQTYLIMELIDGEDLSAYVQRCGKLPVADALAVIEQAALGLQAALEKNIIHRDIKPANLLLTSDGRVKVSDLGLAKKLDEDTDVTATGVGIGSPHFLAPEQADDARNVDHRADIYSLGITLMFLVTGRKPFDGTSAFSVVLSHANKPLPSGAELGTPLPDNLEHLVHRMAAKNPSERYQNYETLLADIGLVRSGYPPVQKIGSEPRARRKLMLAFSAIIVFAALVVAVWSFLLPAGKKITASTTQPTTPNPPLKTDNPPPPQQGAKGKSRPFPLGLMPRPSFSPLKEGPLPKMATEADAYANANPTNYIEIINRYDQISRLATEMGAPRARELQQRAADWRFAHQAASLYAVGEFAKKMDALLAQNKREEAWDVWKTFPSNLRTPDVDQQIARLLEDKFPEYGPIILGNGGMP